MDSREVANHFCVLPSWQESATMAELCDSGCVDLDFKRRRLLDAGGPVEDDETARQKMRDANVGENDDDGITGFDPDDVADIKYFSACDYNDLFKIKPMGYFAENGDLPMMRWLYVNGADTQDEDVGYNFPMYGAALRGHLETCKWIFDRGASADIQRRTKASKPFKGNNDLTCLKVAFKNGYRELSRWLILNGALCKNNTPGELDLRATKRDLSSSYLGHNFLMEERTSLLEWANGLQNARESFPHISDGHTLSCRVLGFIFTEASCKEADV